MQREAAWVRRTHFDGPGDVLLTPHAGKGSTKYNVVTRLAFSDGITRVLAINLYVEYILYLCYCRFFSDMKQFLFSGESDGFGVSFQAHLQYDT